MTERLGPPVTLVAEVSVVADAVVLVARHGDGEGREADLLVEELLVEDVSIDGMCGVY